MRHLRPKRKFLYLPHPKGASSIIIINSQNRPNLSVSLRGFAPRYSSYRKIWVQFLINQEIFREVAA